MDLIVEAREKFGKANRAARRMGIIPAELYGHGIQNVHLAVKEKDFAKVFKQAGESTLLNLVVQGVKRPALVHDVERNYLTGEVMHIDFYQVRLDEKIKTRVPVEFRGEAPAVKEKGGFLNKSLSEIEIESLPGDLPPSLPLDLGPLDDINKSLYVKNLEIPVRVRVLIDPETVIVTVTPPAVEEEKVEVTPDVSAVKVEAEEKKAERATERSKDVKKENAEKL